MHSSPSTRGRHGSTGRTSTAAPSDPALTVQHMEHCENCDALIEQGADCARCFRNNDLDLTACFKVEARGALPRAAMLREAQHILEHRDRYGRPVRARAHGLLAVLGNQVPLANSPRAEVPVRVVQPIAPVARGAAQRVTSPVHRPLLIEVAVLDREAVDQRPQTRELQLPVAAG